ncbi:MAG TPA: hypothetical protein VG992_03060, partial [Candidatus Saccharimonadales bacterium]|nr:hypothetical protein [Candidatus Saccharimonadales bacterium]
YVFIDPATASPDQIDPIHASILEQLQPDYYVTDGPDPRFVDLLPDEQFIVLDRVGGGQHGSTSAIIEYIQSLS